MSRTLSMPWIAFFVFSEFGRLTRPGRPLGLDPSLRLLSTVAGVLPLAPLFAPRSDAIRSTRPRFLPALWPITNYSLNYCLTHQWFGVLYNATPCVLCILPFHGSSPMNCINCAFHASHCLNSCYSSGSPSRMSGRLSWRARSAICLISSCDNAGALPPVISIRCGVSV